MQAVSQQPTIVASENGRYGILAAMAILRAGGTALDAVEAAARVVENDPEDHSVGYGGLPNVLGEVELDASIMDGRTLRAGAVAAVQGYGRAITLARKVMEETPHVLLVGRGAERLAAELGEKPANQHTVATLRQWEERFAERGLAHAGDETLRAKARILTRPVTLQDKLYTADRVDTLGTVNFVALDAHGDLASAVTTSGLAWKYPGRVGDSPLIGAGNYCDNRYGGVACTGMGELAIRAGTARSLILYLKMGMSLREAGLETLRDLFHLEAGPGQYMNIVALAPTGEFAGFTTVPNAKFMVMTADQAAPCSLIGLAWSAEAMSTVVKMPQLGESVVEGTVSRWLKVPGDWVAKREPLLEITTDKIDTEVPAPIDGTLLEILVEAGVTVKAGVALATIGEGRETGSAKRGTGSAEPALGDSPQAASPALPPGAPRPSPLAPPSGRPFISPVVARMATVLDVDLARVPGTGLNGRITKKDLEAYLAGIAEQVAAAETVVAAAPVHEPENKIAPVKLSADEVLRPLTVMRRAIAQHMVMSKRTSPHVTSIFEVDMTAVVRHREVNKRSFIQSGVALTYTPYFVAAIAAGLKHVPEANSRFTEEGVVLSKRIHVGVAVALTNGLIVPVIRDADEKNLQGLARTVNDLVTRARASQLQPDEIRDGTFTLTNHGTGGSLFATPIINQPQCGILGVGAIVKRPVVRSSTPSLLPSADDAIVIRPMTFLSLTFDHRVLDGAQADAFLTVVKQRLENWV